MIPFNYLKTDQLLLLLLLLVVEVVDSLCEKC